MNDNTIKTSYKTSYGSGYIGRIFDADKKLMIGNPKGTVKWMSSTCFNSDSELDFTNMTNYSTATSAKTDFNGKQNTSNLLSFASSKGRTSEAASYCKNLSVGSYGAGKWYLPAAGELYAAHEAGIRLRNPSMSYYPYFWSSTEKDAKTAWQVVVGTGGVDDSGNTVPSGTMKASSKACGCISCQAAACVTNYTNSCVDTCVPDPSELVNAGFSLKTKSSSCSRGYDTETKLDNCGNVYYKCNLHICPASYKEINPSSCVAPANGNPHVTYIVNLSDPCYSGNKTLYSCNITKECDYSYYPFNDPEQCQMYFGTSPSEKCEALPDELVADFAERGEEIPEQLRQMFTMYRCEGM